MKSRLAIIIVSLFVITALLVAGCTPEAPTTPTTPTPGPEEETFTWNVQSTYALGTPGSLTVAALLEDHIYKATGGRLDITFHAPDAIVPAYEGFEGTQDGLLDGVHITLSDERGKFGYAADLFNQYACGPTSQEMGAWLHQGDGMALQQQTLEKAGFTNVVAVEQVDMYYPEDELWCNVPITKKEDYKGLKIRTFGYWGQVLEKAGASIVTLPGAEVYPSLERGVIDACELGTPAGNFAIGLHEICDYCYAPGVHSPGNVHYLMCNKGSWDALPTDIQDIVKRECLATTFECGNKLAILDAEARAKMRDYGTNLDILPMDVQAWIVVTADSIWGEFAEEDAWYAEVFDNQNAFLDVYRGLVAEMLPDIRGLRIYAEENGITPS
jgi:TRAP-type mannitol/chloroaromatic compound transport system substrate-binding protein